LISYATNGVPTATHGRPCGLRTYLIGEDEVAPDVEVLPGHEAAIPITVVDALQPTCGVEVLGLREQAGTIEPDERASG
jgi:hypothetical protein